MSINTKLDLPIHLLPKEIMYLVAQHLPAKQACYIIALWVKSTSTTSSWDKQKAAVLVSPFVNDPIFWGMWGQTNPQKVSDLYNKVRYTSHQYIAINCTDILDKGNALIDAINSNDTSTVEELLKKDPSLINYRDANGHITLICAQSTEMIHLLIEHGATLDVVDDEGNTVLHYAARYKPRFINLLLGYIWDPSAEHVLPTVPLEARTLSPRESTWHPPGQHSLAIGTIGVNTFTRSGPVVVSVPDNTKLHDYLPNYKPSETTQLSTLCSYIERKNNDGDTVLHSYAKYFPHPKDNPYQYPFWMMLPFYQIILDLIKIGFDLNITNNEGETFLHTAIRYKLNLHSGNYLEEIIFGMGANKTLYVYLKEQVNRKIVTHKGDTFLHYICRYNVHLLGDFKRDDFSWDQDIINAKNSKGDAPIHDLIETKNSMDGYEHQISEGLITFLRQKGANGSLFNGNGKTPLDLALTSSTSDHLLNPLLEYSKTLISNKGYTLPFSLAGDFAIATKSTIGEICNIWKDLFKNTNDDRLTSLHIAATLLSSVLIDYFYSRGDELDAVDAKGYSPLFLFVQQSIDTHQTVFEEPIKQLATSSNVNLTPTSSQETPLSLIIKRNDPIDEAVVTLLLNLGAYPPALSETSSLYETCLTQFSKCPITNDRFYPFFAYLMKQDPNEVNNILDHTSLRLTADDLQNTKKEFDEVLNWVVTIGNEKILGQLIDLNLTPHIISAAESLDPSKQTDLVKSLVNHGADYNVPELYQLAKTNQELSDHLRHLYIRDQISAIAPYFFAGLATFFLAGSMSRRYNGPRNLSHLLSL